MNSNIQTLSSFIWSVADLLRGDFKQSQYGRIILPLTVLRRLEAVLESKREKVFEKAKTLKGMNEEAKEKILKKEAGEAFYNTSKLTLSNISNKDPLSDMESYLKSFSKDVREIFDNFKFSEFLSELDRANLLFTVIQKYKEVDLSPKRISNYDMGLVFEDLIRRFAESSNETAGEHFTPRDMVRLTTSLVFSEDDEVLTKKGVVRHIYDPTAGTGGFLSSGMEYLHELNETAQLIGFGQELNPESYAICKADMLIKGQDVSNIKLGNTLSDDQIVDKKFDYLLSNPPFGVDWKKSEKAVTDEHNKKGMSGRFGPGLPRVSDGSLLFLLHLVSKMRPLAKESNGSRIGIILNGSPLFTGDAGGGESEIRRYLLENDLIESIICLPSDMFFNTGITTYIWVLTNNKIKSRKGKVQLINASELYEKMKKNLGAKRKLLTEKHIEDVVKLFGEFKDKEIKNENGDIILESRIFNYKDFGYRKVYIDRPLKLKFRPRDKECIDTLADDPNFSKLDDPLKEEILKALSKLSVEYKSRDSFLEELQSKLGKKIKLTNSQLNLISKTIGQTDINADVCYNSKNQVEADSTLRDYENVPLMEDIQTYFSKEVLPHVPDAWIDESKKDHLDSEIGLVGYEIPFNRYFYKYKLPRKLEDIDTDLDIIAKDIVGMLNELHS